MNVLAHSTTQVPVTTVQCHAANLVDLPDGALGCGWFGGTQEGLPDISVWFARQENDGSWSTPVRVSDDAGKSEQNPVPYMAPTGELHLFYTAQRLGSQDTAEIRSAVSSDGGRTWTRGKVGMSNPHGHGMFVRQPPVQLDSGALVVPVFCCPTPEHGPWVGDDDYSAVMVSQNGGQDWQFHAVPDSTGCVHMNILQLPDGSFTALYRRRQADFIFRSVSADAIEWSSPEPTALPNNNSSIQATVLADGRILLAYNHSSRLDATDRRTSLYEEIDDSAAAGEATAGTAFWGAPRAPMSLAVSSDGGATWSRVGNLEEGNGYCLTNNSADGSNRELSYPSVLQMPDGTIRVAYTHFRRTISLASLAPETLR